MLSVHQAQQIRAEPPPKQEVPDGDSTGYLTSVFTFVRERLVLSRQSRGPTTLVVIGLVLFTGFLDLATGPELSLSIFYLFPIALAAWHLSDLAGVLTSVACAGAWLVADMVSNTYAIFSAVPFWNATVRLAVFVIVAVLISTVRRLTDSLEETVQQRTTQLRHEISERRKLEQEVIGLLRQHDQSVAHELHDGLAQVLTGISFKAKMLEEELEESASPHARTARDITHHLNKAIGQTRDIARGLDPVEVEADELRSALQKLVLEVCSTFHVACSLLSSTSPIIVDGFTGLHLYRIAQQAIDNAIRHGSAKHIDLEIIRVNNEVQLRITDDGAGFETTHPARGLGLRSMKFRADLLGGVLNISSSPGKGTYVDCRVPEIPPHQTTR